MPPIKVQKTGGLLPAARRPISTRAHKNVVEEDAPMIGKRKAEESPLKNDKVKRSALGNLTNAVFNYIDDSKKQGSQKVQALKNCVLSNNISKQSKNNNQLDENLKVNAIEKLFSIPNDAAPPQRQTKIMTRAASRAAQPSSRQTVNDENSTIDAISKKNAQTTAKPKNKMGNILAVPTQTIKNEKRTNGSNGKAASRRISIEFDLHDEDSRYLSALEDLYVLVLTY